MNAFREIFGRCLLLFGGVGLALTLTAWMLCAWNAAVSERISALCAAWKRSSFLTRVVSVAFVGVLVAYASTKPPENEQEGRYLCLISSLPEGQSEEPAPDPRQGETILTREWNLPGAWEYSMRRQDFANGFVFPYGTNHLTCVHVSSQGYLCESRFSTNVIASIGVPVAVVPRLTVCSHEYTVSNTYLFSWTNAAVNRDTNTLVSASLELLRNGDIVITTNGFTRTVPRELPFVHDGYGQDEAWVRANFGLLRDIDPSLTNVEQVLSVGYANWVDAMVGVGLTNGLYKFTASFTEVPPETTQFWIGDYSLAVTNSGEYVFVLKKGEEYGFDTGPYDETVDYRMQDDLGPDSPMVMSWWGGWEPHGEWSVDGGWNWISSPYRGLQWSYPGYCSWMPVLQGAPNVLHLVPGDFPVRFSANLIDYPNSGQVRYSWTSPVESISIANPYEQSTEVTVGSYPGFERFQIGVSADVGGQTLRSSISSTYGTNGYPGVAVRISAPEIVFLNDDMRESRFYLVECSLYSPVDTNVTFTLNHTGNTIPGFYEDREALNNVEISSPRQIRLNAGSAEVACWFYLSCLETGSGTIEVEVSDESGVINSATKSYRCIEPLQRLVTTETAPDGRIVNPSRLVYGSSAYLQVGVNGDFSESDIHWTISGPATLSATCGFRVVVTPTAEEGNVTVEARFGNDARYHPSFVLPIVKPRIREIQLYYINNDNMDAPRGLKTLPLRLAAANSIFAQVGVSFVLRETPIIVTNSNYAVLPEYDLLVADDGTKSMSKTLSAKVQRLLGETPAPGSQCVRLYIAHRIENSDGIAFAARSYGAIFMTSRGSVNVLAHELGHLLGLNDIYLARDMASGTQTIPRLLSAPQAGLFVDKKRDWGNELGRAFYPVSDSCGSIIEDLLMYGEDQDPRNSGAKDIPSGRVEGFSKWSLQVDDLYDVEVGADIIEGKGL